jgi:type IV secretion system protein VirB6
VSACQAQIESATSGVAAALRSVDCIASESAGEAFGRLFGMNGGLLPALTILLTLYVAFIAISLLTGRSQLTVSALTPRMITLGMVLTFATSWVAYQSVVWNLATGAPDELAGIMTGSPGSATRLFADRIDLIFAAIAEAAAEASDAAPAEEGAGGSFTPANLMWLGALLLLLGTVGVLVTSKIALAVLVAIGPIFVVLALFNGTRGLFAGWVRAVVMLAVTPLFVVLGGHLTTELAVPVISGLRGAEGVDGRAAIGLFMVASIHCALMLMVLRASATMVAGWRIFGMGAPEAPAAERAAHSAAPPAAAPAEGRRVVVEAAATIDRQRLSLFGAAPASSHPAPAAAAPGPQAGSSRREVISIAEARPASAGAPSRLKLTQIGSRFPAARPKLRENGR